MIEIEIQKKNVVKDYVVIQVTYASYLKDEIITYSKVGYVLQGGAFVARLNDQPYFCQAMVKY